MSQFHYLLSISPSPAARHYHPTLSIWLSVDPLADKYPGVSPYTYCADNPVRLVDADGKEPIKPYVGTVDGFVAFMNSLSTGIGKAKGEQASSAMLRMSETKGIKPATTAPFNKSNGNRYIYTRKGGWIDMAHFMFYAGTAYSNKLKKQEAQKFTQNKAFHLLSVFDQAYFVKIANSDPIGETVQLGYLQERADKYLAKQSAYSYEDLPTDKFAAEFGAKYFDPNSEKTLGEQIGDYLNNVLHATDPAKAPNYPNLPEEYPSKPTLTNHTTTPLFVTE